jgi:hypothetical protein
MATLIQVLVAALLGGLARRMIGTPMFKRWAGQIVSAIAAVIATYHLGWQAIVIFPLTMTVIWGLPWHGESIERPAMMAGRMAMATIGLWLLLRAVGAEASVIMALSGFGVGGIYAGAKLLFNKPGATGEKFLEDWNSWAEIGFGFWMLLVLALGARGY